LLELFVPQAAMLSVRLYTVVHANPREAASRFSVLDKPFSWTIRVYYEDTDTCGIVYYANYLKFFERARTEWLRSVGFEQQKMAEELGLRFVIASIECDFKLPARLDDVIDIDVRVARLGSASMVFDQSANRGTSMLAAARVRVGCIEAKTFIPAPLPALLRAAVEQLPQHHA
jgi:acyl-CoA thioester hydrolase